MWKRTAFLAGDPLNPNLLYFSRFDLPEAFPLSNAIEFDDPDHSIQEERFILLGLSQNLKVLVVCHCYRSDESKIRIISARKATKQEQAVYFRRP